jgi:hypothetical protein
VSQLESLKVSQKVSQLESLKESQLQNQKAQVIITASDGFIDLSFVI